tara:strand:+ start:1786 stop:2421 length:636 start_codon:yes stop_codon:yes gene_type:complete
MIPVKICGITSFADAQMVIDQGVSAIGFIFYEKSPRVISIEKAKNISSNISDSVHKVGVFVNNSSGFIEEVLSEVPLSSIQLHGDETPKFCRYFDVPVIKALRISSKTNFQDLDKFNVKGFLFDSYSKGFYGGSGQTFNWSLLKNFSKQIPFILSGGLNPKNVKSAINQNFPFAIDVNSGVESSPGIKDLTLTKKLMNELSSTKDTGFKFG